MVVNFFNEDGNSAYVGFDMNDSNPAETSVSLSNDEEVFEFLGLNQQVAG